MAADLHQTLQRLETKFNPEEAKGLDEVFQFEVLAAGTSPQEVASSSHLNSSNHLNSSSHLNSSYHLIVSAQTCQLAAGEHPDPSVTFIATKEVLKDLFKGNLSGSQAFLSGQIKVEGSLLLANKLKKIFAI